MGIFTDTFDAFTCLVGLETIPSSKGILILLMGCANDHWAHPFVEGTGKLSKYLIQKSFHVRSIQKKKTQSSYNLIGFVNFCLVSLLSDKSPTKENLKLLVKVN